MIYFADTKTLVSLIELVGLVSLGAGLVWANFHNSDKKQTDDNLKEAYAGSQALVGVLKEQNDQYQKDFRDLQDKHTDAQREMGELRGELKTLRDIPLKDIATNLKMLNKSVQDMPTHLRDMATEVANAAADRNLAEYKKMQPSPINIEHATVNSNDKK